MGEISGSLISIIKESSGLPALLPLKAILNFLLTGNGLLLTQIVQGARQFIQFLLKEVRQKDLPGTRVLLRFADGLRMADVYFIHPPGRMHQVDLPDCGQYLWKEVLQLY
jgi:hypothetical protein